jgi:hypothetical protein
MGVGGGLEIGELGYWRRWIMHAALRTCCINWPSSIV